MQSWLSNNPTLRPAYVILFQGLPQEVDYDTTNEDINSSDALAAPSVQYQLHYSTSPGWYPFVTAINMNGTSGTNVQSSDGTNDSIAYIKKIISMASNNPRGSLFISATANGYANTNWYFDYLGDPSYVYGPYAINAQYGVTNINPTANVIGTSGTNAYGENFTAQATNVAGYYTGGWDSATGCHGTNDGYCFVDGSVRFFGNSGWFIMSTIDSFNGQRVTFQAGYLTWFATNAFGGTNYSNTPVGAVTTVNEPRLQGKPSSAVYYGEWSAGKSFALSAWDAQIEGNGIPVVYFHAVGDPFIRK